MKNYYLDFVSQKLNIPIKNLNAAISLLEDGNSVPFISRYRKEKTGNLDEIALFEIEASLKRYYELEERKDTILRTIEDQGLLTDDLRKSIENEVEPTKLEDLYLPFRPKRRTKAIMHAKKDLNPWRK